MAGSQTYRTAGNTALAHRWEERGRDAAIIDFDIARRSYDTRMRLAQRALNRESGLTPETESTRSLLRPESDCAWPSLDDIAREEYHPNRGIIEMLGETVSGIRMLISNHPLSQQLRYGDIRGRSPREIPGRQLVASSALCMAIATSLIVIC